MKISINEKLIKRNLRIGQITSIASLAVLGLGLYLSFQTQIPLAISLSFVCLILGFVISQVGIYYGNRWGRSPRPDERITTGLKGLGERYTLYHYTTPVPHLLIGPAGIFVILPYTVGGTISYNDKKKRWHQKGGSLYLKIFAQESLGRPDIEVSAYKEDVEKYLRKKLNLTELPPVQVVIVFTSEKADVQAPDAPTPTLPISKLKDYIRKFPKETQLSMDTVKTIQVGLPEPTSE